MQHPYAIMMELDAQLTEIYIWFLHLHVGTIVA